MPSNQTANYQLSQWSKDDRVLMDDFNADNAKIDGALGAHAAALAKLGNCQIYTVTYTGNGLTGPDNLSSLTFPMAPALVVIAGNLDSQYVGIMVQGSNLFKAIAGTCANGVATWSNGGRTVSWYPQAHASAQLNEKGLVYHAVALCPVAD